MDKNKLGAEALRGRPPKEADKLSRSINLKLTTADYESVQKKREKLSLPRPNMHGK